MNDITMSELDAANRFAVAVAGGDRGITILNPPTRGAVMTRQAALILAAWIVALADEGDFAEIRSAVERT